MIIKVVLVLYLVESVVLAALEDETYDQNSLELVHVLFRHGDRTNIKLALYPSDPYINETYYPYGYGALTKIFFGISCSNYQKQYDEYIKSEKIMKKFLQHNNITDYISKHAGKNITSYRDILFLWFCLKVEEEWGLKLPPWTSEVYPEPLKTLALEQYVVSTGTSQLRKLSAGYLLKKIIDDTREKIEGDGHMREKKIMLYSGHDFNIGMMLATLDLYAKHPEIPPYGSHLIFEVHNTNGVYGLKIFYQNYETSEPKLLKLAGCEELCEFHKFVELVEEYLPTDEGCGEY